MIAKPDLTVSPSPEVGVAWVLTCLGELRNCADALDNCAAVVQIKDVSGRYIFVNRAYERLLGVPREAVVGRSVYDRFPATTADVLLANDRQVVTEARPLRLEELVPSAGGGTHVFDSLKFPLYAPDGTVFAVCGVSVDITGRARTDEDVTRAMAALGLGREEVLCAILELRKSDEQLREIRLHMIETDRLRAVGQFAAGVVHELKNPLSVLAMGVRYLSGSALVTGAGDAGVVRLLADMADALTRARTLVLELLEYAAPRAAPATEPTDLNLVIERSVLLVRHDLLRSRVSLDPRLGAGLPPIHVDAKKIEQVFVNVFTNAMQAMEPGGGTLTVTTRERPRGRAAAGAGAGEGDGGGDGGGVGAGGAVVAEVDDTGPGIPPDKLPRIFDAFFTTKAPGDGTGLGLTVTKAIMEMHHGTIRISNRDGGGTHVVIELPCETPHPEECQT